MQEKKHREGRFFSLSAVLLRRFSASLLRGQKKCSCIGNGPTMDRQCIDIGPTITRERPLRSK